MLDIPGKACGPCSFCCKVLEIDEFKKPAGKLCAHCALTGGCGVYETRPQVCRDYHCRWKEERELVAAAAARPRRHAADGRSRTATNITPSATRKSRFPGAIRSYSSISSREAKAGRIVVAKAGLRAWRIFADGTGRNGPERARSRAACAARRSRASRCAVAR